MARDKNIVGRNAFGPQEPQADLPENAPVGLPQFYDCGICGHLHPASWNGDCRDDNNRFTNDEVDAKYGQQDVGWVEVPMPDTEEEQEFEGTVETCCHRVSFRYADFESELTSELERHLTDAAEERAKEMINEGCHSGELCYLHVAGEDAAEEEIRGWWEIHARH